MPRSVDHKRIRFWTHTRRRRQSQLIRALVVGLAAGALGVLFQYGLSFAESQRFALLGALEGSPFRWVIVPVLCAVAGATSRMITGAWAPEASGSGIPHVKGVLLGLRSLKKRIIPVKFLGGMLAIGAGFSLGREGPTVQMGAVAGHAVSQFLGVPPRYRPQLVAAGAGAGLAAAFNAPLAGFVFVIEELQREMSPYTYGAALAATVVADVVTRTFIGQFPSFDITRISIPPLNHLPLFLLLGLLCGLLGTLFNVALPGAMNAMQRIPGPRWGKAGAVGAAVGIAILIFPSATGGGQHIAEIILQGRAVELLKTVPFATGLLGFLGALLAAKFLLTLFSYAAGVPGGIFAPLLVIGSVTGALFGELIDLWVPGLVAHPEAFGVLGMAALFAAVVRSPLTGVVLILEMTGSHALLFALIVTAMTAYFVADFLGTKPIYEALLERDLRRSDPSRNDDPDDPILVNMVVEPFSAMEGRLVKNLGLPKGCLLITITRGGHEIIPDGGTELQGGDQLMVLTSGTCPIPDIRHKGQFGGDVA